MSGNVRKAWVIVLACVVHVGISIVVNQWLFPQRILVPIGLATGENR